MSTNTSAPTQPTDAGPARKEMPKALELLLTNRTVLIAVLLALVVIGFFAADAAGALRGAYNPDYMFSSLINLVPLTMLALAQLVVIVSGGGGIDLSVGSIVSLTGMVFGFMYGLWGFPLWVAIILAVLVGALLGGINGVLVAVFGFPPLITTLATYYAYWSLALVINNQSPISTEPIQGLYSLSRSFELPLIGQYLPLVPQGLVLFLLPTVVVVWYMMSRTTFGRKIYAIGTNDKAADWSGIDVQVSRGMAYVISGAISGLVAVVTVSQFASARPDSGTTGNGMALPAITIAVLGGVAITGGIGRVLGVILAALLIVWLDAGILLLFTGNVAGQVQLAALGFILVGAALLNGITTRRLSGSR